MRRDKHLFNIHIQGSLRSVLDLDSEFALQEWVRICFLVLVPSSVHHYVYYDCVHVYLKETYGFLLNLPLLVWNYIADEFFFFALLIPSLISMELYSRRVLFFCFAYTFPY